PRPYATEWSALGPDRSALAALETGSPVDRPAGSPSPAGPDLRPWLSGFALAAAIGAVALDAAKRREGSRR
ncbi:MAG: hypothetical protein HYY93_03795, partial [Planctomycetes bacterium]|nr:hypothetical protein [Planctomycetota bacterium]